MLPDNGPRKVLDNSEEQRTTLEQLRSIGCQTQKELKVNYLFYEAL
jgi:hypothetical protein